MLSQEKKTTKLMGLNGTKNISRFKSCLDELRLVFLSTCKVFSGQKRANSFSQFLLSLFYSPPADYFIPLYIYIYICFVSAQRELDKPTVPYHAIFVPWSNYGSGLHCATH